MKPFAYSTIKSSFLVLLFVLLSAPAYAQDAARLRIDSLDRLESIAEQTIDVTLDGKVLQLAISFLSDKKPNEKKVKEIVAGIKGIYVKVYEFDKDNMYTSADMDVIRTQLRNPLWSRMVEVRSKKQGQVVDVYTMIEGGKINGLAVLVTEARQVAIINIVGPVDVDKLSELRGSFGIPDIEIIRNEKTQED
jgi:hypothetical protein